MDNEEFADELIRRLNRLCQDEAARDAVVKLLDSKVSVGNTLDDHPTCQVSEGGVMGFLGMLNGLTGVIGHGPRASWGLICAGYSGEAINPAEFIGFFKTEEHPMSKADPCRTPRDQDGES